MNLHRALSALLAIVSTVAVTATFAAACAENGPPELPEPVGETHDELSELSIERIIPLRFIQMVPTSTSSDLVAADNVLWSIHRANRLYGQAGVQYAARSIDKIAMPHFNVLGTSTVTWATVKAEVQLALSNVPATAWPDATAHTPADWLKLVAARFSPDDYAIVWIPGSSSDSFAEFPWSGRSIVMAPFNFPTPSAPPFPSCGTGVSVPTNNFTHELGHFLGLAHTWQLGGTNPRTGSPILLSDYWDVVYCPASSCGIDLFFNSSSEAAVYESALQAIDRRYPDPGHTIWPSDRTWCWSSTGDAVSCCPDCANGTISCKLPAPGGGYTTYTAGHPGMKGMLYDYGPNVQQGISVIASNYNSEVGLSTSQKLQIRRALRYDLPLDSSVQSQLNLPAGSVATGRRHVLGMTFNREMAHQLDFDGDNKRDIAVWVPPPSSWSATKGTFLVLLSGQNYSAAQMMVKNLGVIGDTPVPADYDGDGKTDFAVFHPAYELTAGDWAYWKWCNSTSNHDCSDAAVQSRQWGIKSDIPLPGLDFDGNPATGELAIFRRSNGRFAWYNIATAASDSRDLGTGRVPLPGLYDSDSKTDLVTWDPVNGSFEMRLSGTNNYNTALTRSFPNVKPTTDGGTASQRASGVPVAVKYNNLAGERRSLSVYDPEGPPDGTWNTMWLPVTSTTLSTCDWGASMDVPLGGYLDLDGDLAGDYVVYRAQTDAAHSFFHILPGSFACSGASQSIDVGIRNHAYPFLADDMDGDGKPELGLYEAATGWTFFFSGESFSTAHAYALGDRTAVPL